MNVLPTLPEGSIDLIVTDPPYSIGTTSNGNKGEWLDNNLIRPFFEIWFREIRRILKPTGEIYMNTDWRTYPFLFPIASRYLNVKNCIVWDYEWIKAGTHYRFSHEFIIYALREGGRNRKFPANERDVWRIKPINFTSNNKFHNAEKPIELVKKMLTNSASKGNAVLDSFAGSGTTMKACLEMNLDCTGIEINPEYIDVCKKRLNWGSSLSNSIEWEFRIVE